jgi:hypothetical protein
VDIPVIPAQLTRFSHRYQTKSQPMVLYDPRGNQYAVKFAERAENGTLGIAREYAAGALAGFVEAPVPSTSFVELTSVALTFDPGIAFEDGSRPAPQVTVGSYYLADAASPSSPGELEAIPAGDAAAILVFNAWVAVGDRHWGNYVIEARTNGPRLFSIDYASCLSTSATAPSGVRDPDLIAIARSVPEAVEEFLRRVGDVSERSIRGVFARIPRDWMTEAERERVANFLLQGRRATRVAVMAALA